MKKKEFKRAAEVAKRKIEEEKIAEDSLKKLVK
jgi:hypothetical protein